MIIKVKNHPKIFKIFKIFKKRKNIKNQKKKAKSKAMALASLVSFQEQEQKQKQKQKSDYELAKARIFLSKTHDSHDCRKSNFVKSKSVIRGGNERLFIASLVDTR